MLPKFQSFFFFKYLTWEKDVAVVWLQHQNTPLCVKLLYSVSPQSTTSVKFYQWWRMCLQSMVRSKSKRQSHWWDTEVLGLGTGLRSQTGFYILTHPSLLYMDKNFHFIQTLLTAHFNLRKVNSFNLTVLISPNCSWHQKIIHVNRGSDCGMSPVYALLLLQKSVTTTENKFKDNSYETFLPGFWGVIVWDITELMSETGLHMKSNK